MADITGVIKDGKKSILGLSQNHAAVTLGIIKGGNKYIVGSSAPAVPDGKTVTPINDVIIWQQCAGISNPTYTTLADVLADTGILQTLMASDNAVDYLVRSKSFIGNEALVPTMTSNTTPSGEAIGIDVYNSNYYYYAFDGNNATFFNPNTYPNNEWVGYDFGTKKSINKAKFYSKSVKTYKIQYSDDGSTWNDATAEKTNSSWGTDTWIDESFSTIVARYWKLLGVTNDGRMVIYSLQFGFDGICQSSSAMTYIGLNNYASNTLLADSDWCAGICNSTYFESVLNVKVPTMTSNTTPSGEASASASQSSSVYPFKAFDGDDTSYWRPSEASTAQSVPVGSITYAFVSAQKIYVVKIKNVVSGGEVVVSHSVTFQYSTDGITYTDISTDTINDAEYVKVIIGPVSARYHRLKYNTANYKNTGNNLYYVRVYTLQLYGREDV